MYHLTGLLYSVLWAFSYVPILLNNLKRGSVAGLSVSLIYINLSAMSCYLLFTIAGYCYLDVGTGVVSPEDLAMALLLFLSVTVVIAQI